MDKTKVEETTLKGVNDIRIIKDPADRNYFMEHNQICTQFEDKYARRLMPCFDEPNFKAVFSVSVQLKHTSHIACSNGQLLAI